MHSLVALLLSWLWKVASLRQALTPACAEGTSENDSLLARRHVLM